MGGVGDNSLTDYWGICTSSFCSFVVQLVATMTMEPSSASSSLAMPHGETSNGILSAMDSVVCAGIPGLEPLVDDASSFSGDGVREHGSGSRVKVTSSSCSHEKWRLKYA